MEVDFITEEVQTKESNSSPLHTPLFQSVGGHGYLEYYAAVERNRPQLTQTGARISQTSR